MVIIDSFWKIGNGKFVKILFPENMIRVLLELHHFINEAKRKKVRAIIKFVKCIIFLCLKFFSSNIISFLSNDTFNNNIAIFISKLCILK